MSVVRPSLHVLDIYGHVFYHMIICIRCVFCRTVFIHVYFANSSQPLKNPPSCSEDQSKLLPHGSRSVLHCES